MAQCKQSNAWPSSPTIHAFPLVVRLICPNVPFFFWSGRLHYTAVAQLQGYYRVWSQVFVYTLLARLSLLI